MEPTPRPHMKRDLRPTPVTDGASRLLRMELPRFRVSYALFPPHHRIPHHYHDRGCVSVVLEGRFLQRFPGRDCECLASGVIVKPPGVRHEDRWYSAETRHLIVEPDRGRENELGECAALLDRVGHVHDPGAAALATRLVRELRDPDDVTELAVEALALELLVRLLRRDGEGGTGGVPPAWLRRVKERLHDLYADGVSLAELAREAGVHPSHLSRSFSRYFGTGMSDYVRALRVDAASRALADTDDPISRIALRTGFSDQSHLTRVLRDATGLTPGEYRASHRQP